MPHTHSFQPTKGTVMATEFYYTPQILRESAEGINRFDIRDEG